ncbi:HAD-superfamily hydrolase, subfamily IA, variant 1 [Rhodospirillum rubrum ATCC 11170]|uniref:phosphoglycolate phosphatase n=2 Tax=Rhodospirillum rubrum TaxID=1085 RepID=Q2RTR2_RHORT|nr:HAD hydrolase-like protein [Rhodospirillum rubrum]ABC22483.1 HAD-superfamily hydrolase, subfamily IA, variant 1 [Rhodospirillum rubrum ATCC 11170]MBK5954067.1 HAD family hydrolase [Rhodospirillum rubrum]HAP99679.1 HAD family hydrolase [Rhodospirillum rubrum]HCF18150.1 HAD family hydrolase [Rhodospirillum rubrum]
MATDPVSMGLSLETARPPRAVLFDWDNTLVDSWPVIHQAMNTTLVAMGHDPWRIEETRTRIGLSLRDGFPQLFGARWEEARDIYYAAFRAVHLDLLRELDGARDLLAALAARGVFLGVVSNKTGAFLREEVSALGLDTLFGAVIGAGDAARDKPAADPALMALDIGGVAPGPDLWFVGDASVDLACAAQIGCLGVLLRPEPPAPGEFADHPPALYRAGCRDLLALLERVGA